MAEKKPIVVKCDVIEAGRFELVDANGDTRAELMMTTSGPTFCLFGDDGHVRLRLAVKDG